MPDLFVQQRGGSSLLLFAALQLSSSAVMLTLFSCYARMLLRWNVLALPLVALLPVSRLHC